MMQKAIKKYWIILCMEFVILAVLLSGCFRKEEKVHAEYSLVLGTGTGNSKYTGENFSLNPGIYQLRITNKGEQDAAAFVDVECGQSSFRALRCNGVTIFPNQEYIDFEIYVSEPIDSAHFSCSYSGTETVIESLELYRTNLGSVIASFLFLLVCLLFDFLLLFREKILSGRISKESQIVFWGLLLSVLLSFYPYLNDYFGSTADGAFHWLRIEGLKETLLQGNQFPVRVQSYWLFDHGYAVSAFYSDLFLGIPLLFRLMGFSIMTSYKMFVFLVMAATAAVAYYSFKKCTKSSYAALFGSVIYVLAPYRLYNFYNRGAVGEYLAMVFLPLVICGMYQLYTADVRGADYKKWKVLLVVGLSGILQSHILTCAMAAGFMAFVCILFWKRTFRRETFVQLLQAAVLCLLLNAWFWVPLLQMMGNDNYTLHEIIRGSIQEMGTWPAGVVQLYPNRGTVQNGMYMAAPIQMGVASFLMILLVAVRLLQKRLQEKGIKKESDGMVLFLSGMVLLTWFMSTRYFPWDLIGRIPVIGVFATAIQFPTRLLSPVSAFAAALAAFFVPWLAKECKEIAASEAIELLLKKGCLTLLYLLAIGSAAYHVNDIAYHMEPLWLYNAENFGTTSVVFGEYLLDQARPDDFYYHGPAAEEGLEWSDYEKQGTLIRMNVKNSTEEERFVELPLIGYKGYGIESSLRGEKMPYITEERGAHGDLRVAIPAGYEGCIEVRYKGFVSFRIAECISVITIAAVVLAAWKRRRVLCGAS